MTRGFAVSAGLDPAVAEPLAARCATLGYGSLWSGDHGADGLETLARFARAAPDVRLGLAMDLAERDAGSVVASVERVGLEPERLTIAVAAPSPDAARRAARELSACLAGTRILLAARSRRELRLVGPDFGGALVSWMPPAMLEASKLELGVSSTHNPNLVAVVRAAVGADAETRLGREEGFARSLPAWREHFDQLPDPGRTGVAVDTAAEMPAALAPYERACDELVVRGLAARKLWNLERIASAAAPPAPQSGGPGTGASRPTSSSVSRETTAPNAK